jgi:hypothetical protein
MNSGSFSLTRALSSWLQGRHHITRLARFARGWRNAPAVAGQKKADVRLTRNSPAQGGYRLLNFL